MRGVFGYPVDVETRGGGGDEDLGVDSALDLGDQSPFGVQILRDRLDHESSAVECSGQVSRVLDDEMIGLGQSVFHQGPASSFRFHGSGFGCLLASSPDTGGKARRDKCSRDPGCHGSGTEHSDPGKTGGGYVHVYGYSISCSLPGPLADRPWENATMGRRSSESSEDEGRGSRLDRPLTTQEAVVRALRESITTGELRPGERLYQDAIAEQMGVSRVPVREALNVLRADGQLEYTPHRGYWVSALSRESVAEINLIRRLLESEAIRLAFASLDQDLVDHMESVNREMTEAHEVDDINQFVRLNHAFHFALFERSGLPRLLQHIEMLWKSVDIYRMSIFTDHDIRDAMLSEHGELIAACRSGDLDAAQDVMEIHRGKAVDALSTLVAPETEAELTEETRAEPAKGGPDHVDPQPDADLTQG